MKQNDLRKMIREEVTKVVRKELVGFVKLLGQANKPKPKPKSKTKKSVSNEQTLKQMMSEFEDTNFEQPQQNFSNNPTLNDILNETANSGTKPGFEPYPDMGGKTFDKSSMAEMLGYGDGVAPTQNVPPMTTPDGQAVQQVPDTVAKAMTRNYGDLMQAIEKKKGGSPLKG